MSVEDLPDGRNIRTAVREWDSGISFGQGANTYKLIKAILSEGERIDDELEEVYDAHHINSATGKNLDKFGQLVDTPRKSGESDSKYRARIKAAFAQAKTRTTYDTFTQFAATVLGTSISNLDFLTPYAQNPATVIIQADASLYENTQFTISEIADLLGGGVPAGHEVQLQSIGTFEVRDEATTNDPSKGLSSDTNEGGTLAEEVT